MRAAERRGLLVLGAFVLVGLFFLLLESGAADRVSRVARDAAPPAREVVEVDLEVLPESPEPPPSAPKKESTGTIHLQGRVLRTGKPVPAARVSCRPNPFWDEVGVLVVDTDALGRFEFRGLPRSTSYRLTATSDAGFASASVPVAAVSAPVELALQGVVYEYLRFVDEEGKPIDVSRLPLGISVGLVVFSSDGAGQRQSRGLLRHLDPPLDLKPNEVFILHEDKRLVFRTSGGLHDPTKRVLSIPGYEATSLPNAQRPLSQWPQGDTVVLRTDPTPSTVTFRVEYPKLAWPASWGDLRPDVRLVAHFPDAGFHRLLSRSANAFFASRETRFLILLNEALLLRDKGGELRYTLVESNKEIAVRPHYPRFAFLDLYFPGSHPEHPSAIGLPRLTGQADLVGELSLPIRGTLIRPGFARFGPLPAGRYIVDLDWVDANGLVVAAWALEPKLELDGGHDVIVAKSRS